MNCLTCAHADEQTPAVAICGRCGAGVCLDHTHESSETLTVTMPINRIVPVEPAARRVRCSSCAAAERAQAAASAPGRRRATRRR